MTRAFLVSLALSLALACLCAGRASMAACSGSSPTWTAATAAVADVSACVTAASSGDTINVPSGTVTWASTLSFCKALTLSGAGAGSTVITAGIGASFGNNLINLNNCNLGTGLIRITGFTMKEATGGQDSFGLIVFWFSTGMQLRVDHNTFDSNGVSPCCGRSVTVHSNNITGVYDHNTNIEIGLIDEGDDARDTTDNCVVSGSPQTCGGNYAWTQPMAFGTANAFYVEDNTFQLTDSNPDLDCEDGGRVVYRYNSVTNDDIGNHGFDSTPRGCLELDSYNNTMTGNSPWAFQFRGGTGVTYNNLIKATYSTAAFGLTNYRSVSDGYVNLYPNRTSPHWCDGSNAYDANTAPSGTNHGWPCFDQPGRGTNQASYPVYIWNNCKTALACTPGGSDQVNASVYSTGSGTDYVTSHIVANRDFYNAVSGFDGTVGVGQGAVASRAATCTTGVAWYDPATKTLYNCSATNTWSTYYVEYTYPHPLQGGAAPTSPQRLRLIRR